MLIRDSPVTSRTGTFASLISDVASQVEHILGHAVRRRAASTRKLAELYARCWSAWSRWSASGGWTPASPSKREVAAHLVNLAWNGLSGLERQARPLIERRRAAG